VFGVVDIDSSLGGGKGSVRRFLSPKWIWVWVTNFPGNVFEVEEPLGSGSKREPVSSFAPFAALTAIEVVDWEDLCVKRRVIGLLALTGELRDAAEPKWESVAVVLCPSESGRCTIRAFGLGTKCLSLTAVPTLPLVDFATSVPFESTEGYSSVGCSSYSCATSQSLTAFNDLLLSVESCFDFASVVSILLDTPGGNAALSDAVKPDDFGFRDSTQRTMSSCRLLFDAALPATWSGLVGMWCGFRPTTRFPLFFLVSCAMMLDKELLGKLELSSVVSTHPFCVAVNKIVKLQCTAGSRDHLEVPEVNLP